MRYITEYKLEWPKRFVLIAEFMKPFLPKNCQMHHIGSTAVPGMPAKDIIDLDMECAVGSLETVIAALKKAGYVHKGDKGMPGREAFRPIPNSRAASLPVHHLYACETGTYELLKHLAYRDYLVANPDRAQWLATQKVAVDASASSKDEYVEKKSACYAIITRESMAWANPSFQTTASVKG